MRPAPLPVPSAWLLAERHGPGVETRFVQPDRVFVVSYWQEMRITPSAIGSEKHRKNPWITRNGLRRKSRSAFLEVSKASNRFRLQAKPHRVGRWISRVI